MYTYFVAIYKLGVLLDTDQTLAYAYAKAGMDSAFSKQAFYEALVDAITYYTGNQTLKPEFFALGAEVLQVQIDEYPYPELLSMHKYYSKLADWHSRANNKAEAVKAIEKAIAALKNKPTATSADQSKLEADLQRYRSM